MNSILINSIATTISGIEFNIFTYRDSFKHVSSMQKLENVCFSIIFKIKLSKQNIESIFPRETWKMSKLKHADILVSPGKGK